MENNSDERAMSSFELDKRIKDLIDLKFTPVFKPEASTHLRRGVIGPTDFDEPLLFFHQPHQEGAIMRLTQTKKRQPSESTYYLNWTDKPITPWFNEIIGKHDIPTYPIIEDYFFDIPSVGSLKKKQKTYPQDNNKKKKVPSSKLLLSLVKRI